VSRRLTLSGPRPVSLQPAGFKQFEGWRCYRDCCSGNRGVTENPFVFNDVTLLPVLPCCAYIQEAPLALGSLLRAREVTRVTGNIYLLGKRERYIGQGLARRSGALILLPELLPEPPARVTRSGGGRPANGRRGRNPRGKSKINIREILIEYRDLFALRRVCSCCSFDYFGAKFNPSPSRGRVGTGGVG
jgi:hypothetical protein